MISTALLLICIARGQAPEMPEFPAKWSQLTSVAGEMRNGKQVARLDAPASGQRFSAAEVELTSLPVDKEIVLHIWIRRNGGSEPAQINAFSYAAGMQSTGIFPTSVPLRRREWTRASAKFVSPEGTRSLQLWIINTGKSPLDLSDPTLEVGATKIVALNGSGVLRASANTTVRGDSGLIRFPIPGPYRDQAPIAFTMRSEPASSLTGWRIKKRWGENWVCEAQVTPPPGGIAHLTWQSLVLVRKVLAKALPKTPLGPAPRELSKWLTPTPVAQATDAAIRAKANELKRGATELSEFAQRVIGFTSSNEGSGKPFVALDAKTALDCGGSCTSRANLAVALLRAAGVPARSVSHLPTWAYGSPLYEHWLVEYWHPGVGWVWLESTMGQVQPEPTNIAVLSVSTIEDELAAGQDNEYQWIMPGAAYMSGIQGFGDLHPAAVAADANANWCQPVRRMAVDAALFQAAIQAWPNLALHQEMEGTALSGSPDELRVALNSVR